MPQISLERLNKALESLKRVYKGIGKQKGVKSDNIRSTFVTYLEMLQK